jgi:hypothetical protein
MDQLVFQASKEIKGIKEWVVSQAKMVKREVLVTLGLQVNLVSLDKLGTREKEEFQDKWELKEMMGNLAFLEFLVNLGKASLEKRDCLDCLESREDLVCREYLESRAILVLMV